MNPTKPIKELSNFDALYHAVFNSLPGNVVIIDNKGAIVKANRNWNAYAIEHGIDTEINWTGQNYLEVCKKLSGISKKDADEACRLMNRLLEGEETDFELVYQGQKADQIQWFKLQASGFEFEGATYATIVHADVTKYSNAQRALKESELDFNLLANSSPGVIYRCCLDDPWEMHSISDKIESLSGYPKEDFVGMNPIRPFGEIMHPDDREEASRLVQIAIDKKESYKLAYRVMHKDGHINYVFGYGRATYKSDGAPDYLVGVIFNDTDRVVALNKVKESEERFRATFEQAAVGIAHVSPNGSFLRINQKFCDIVGYSQQEMLALTFHDITHPDDLALDIDNVNKLLQDKLENYSMVKRYFHKNGSITWVNLTVSLMKTLAGEPDYFVSVIEEITARIEAEKKVQESEALFRSLMQQSPFSVNISNIDGSIKEVNAAFMKMWGITDETVSEFYEKFNFWKDEQANEPENMSYIMRAFNGEAVLQPPFEYDGVQAFEAIDYNSIKSRKRWLQNRIYPVKDSNGVLFNLVWLTEDITERVEAEKKVQESQENYRTLIEQANDGIVVLQDAKIKFANSALTRITGYSVEELTGSNFIDFIDEKELDKVNAQYVKRINGEQVAAYESKIIHKNGSVIDVEFNGRLTHYKGQVANLAMVRDISERKKAEEDRNQLFNLSSDLIGIADFNAIIKQLNPAWETTLGYTQDELMAKPFYDFIHPDDHHKTEAEMEKLATGQTTIDFENRYIHKNGSIIHIFWAATPLPDQGLIYCIGRDVTERKKVETKILQYQRRLKDQAIELTLSEEKQRKEIAVDLHDQVGQSLAYSRMQLAALTMNLSKEEILNKTGDISKGLLSAIETTRSVIFDLSPPQLEELGLFAAIADWMEEEIEQHTNIQTSISGDEQRYPLNENVRILLFRCVRELLINTLKHAAATKLNVHIEYSKADLEIIVSDNGIGFNYQPETLKLKNTGFGLFSVLERITDLGGSLDIKTAPGNGTDIILKVPVTL